MKLEQKGICIVLLFTLICGVVAISLGGFVLSFLFYASLCLSLYELFVYFTCLRRIEVIRKVSHKRLMAGERIRVHLNVVRPRNSFFHWLILHDRSDLEEKSSLGQTHFLITKEREAIFEYGIYHLKRGRYQFHEIECKAGDLFGIVERTKKIEQFHSIVVFPKVRPLPHWDLSAEVHGNKKTVNQRTHSEYSAIFGLRNYQVGDRLQQIHWKATARGQGIKVKEFEKEVSKEFLFLLDQRKHAYPAGAEELFERAVSLTASLLNEATARRLTTSLMLTGSCPMTVKAGRSQEHFMKMLEYLVDVKADGNYSLSRAFSSLSYSRKKEIKVVLITSKLDESVRALVSELRRNKLGCQVFWVTSQVDASRTERNFSTSVYEVTDDEFTQLGKRGEKIGTNI